MSEENTASIEAPLTSPDTFAAAAAEAAAILGGDAFGESDSPETHEAAEPEPPQEVEAPPEPAQPSVRERINARRDKLARSLAAKELEIQKFQPEMERFSRYQKLAKDAPHELAKELGLNLEDMVSRQLEAGTPEEKIRQLEKTFNDTVKKYEDERKSVQIQQAVLQYTDTIEKECPIASAWYGEDQQELLKQGAWLEEKYLKETGQYPKPADVAKALEHLTLERIKAVANKAGVRFVAIDEPDEKPRTGKAGSSRNLGNPMERSVLDGTKALSHEERRKLAVNEAKKLLEE